MDNPLTVITNFGDWKSRKSEVKGVVKRDWVPTGRIDFATRGREGKERRIIESVAGNEHLEFNGGSPR